MCAGLRSLRHESENRKRSWNLGEAGDRSRGHPTLVPIHPHHQPPLQLMRSRLCDVATHRSAPMDAVSTDPSEEAADLARHRYQNARRILATFRTAVRPDSAEEERLRRRASTTLARSDLNANPDSSR